MNPLVILTLYLLALMAVHVVVLREVVLQAMVFQYMVIKENYRVLAEFQHRLYPYHEASAEFQQRLKTGSCIYCGEQGHIFEACAKPKPS